MSSWLILWAEQGPGMHKLTDCSCNKCKDWAAVIIGTVFRWRTVISYARKHGSALKYIRKWCYNFSSDRDTELHEKVLQLSLKSLICNTVNLWEALSIEVAPRARYPKALLEGGHDCRLAVRALQRLKAVCRLMSPHESLMSKVLPKRWRLQEKRKTLISRIAT